jgi:acetyltransferase-like isoleucine patch superfamily enzyme
VRIIGIIWGNLWLLIKEVLSLGKFRFIPPIKIERGVIISRRPRGKIILGEHVSLNHNSCISVTWDALLSIGSFSSIGDNNVIVAKEKITIGNNTMFGPNVCIYDHDHIFNAPGIIQDLGYKTKPVIIEDNVWLGAGVIVLKGVRIGTGSVIAAGTIITKDIPSNSLVYNKRDLIIKERY